MILKGLLNKFRSNAQFCLYYRRGKFHFGHRGLETPKTSKFVPKKDFSWGQEGAALGVKKAKARHNYETEVK